MDGGRLAGAVRAEISEDFALVNLEVEVEETPPADSSCSGRECGLLPSWSRPARQGPAIASFHSRMDQRRTTPFRTKGSLLANASAASRVVKIAIDPSSWGLAKVPIISSVPSSWNSLQRATWERKCGGAFERTSSADS